MHGNNEPTAHLLVVDDEAPIRTTLSALLGRAGYHVTTASSGEDAVALLDTHRYDLLLVDLKMPGIDGMAVVRAAQERDPDVVILILTGHGSLESAIEGLRRNIFDYLLKTGDPRDVLQRVEAGLHYRTQLQRRKQMLQTLVATASELTGEAAAPEAATAVPNAADQTEAATPSALQVGALRIDPLWQEVEVEGRKVALTPTELRVLVCLAQHASSMLSYVQLVACVHGYQSFPAEASELIKPHIHHLRQKLEPDPARPKYVLNVRGKGYMLAAGDQS